jgi:hypothetical protein
MLVALALGLLRLLGLEFSGALRQHTLRMNDRHKLRLST